MENTRSTYTQADRLRTLEAAHHRVAELDQAAAAARALGGAGIDRIGAATRAMHAEGQADFWRGTIARLEQEIAADAGHTADRLQAALEQREVVNLPDSQRSIVAPEDRR